MKRAAKRGQPSAARASRPKVARGAPRPARAPKRERTVTPLAERMDAPARATPKDVFDLAMRWWMQGERFDIGKMAQALKLSRATVFRWVGSRELLYGEVLASLFEGAMEEAKASAQGTGPTLIADVTRRLMTALINHEPMRVFLEQDPEYAMRVLMSRSSSVEQRSAKTVRTALEEAVRLGHIQPELELDALSYLIVRIGESFLYREAITGEPADIEPAITAIQLLLTAKSGRGA
ncbi:MAG TPA: QsdR family transcriptional regulator [Myxococcaceae bacterium]|nr:QsdR family transcriptional regulator [Myxococcaceae bacterium]